MDKKWELYWKHAKASLHLFKKKEFILDIVSEIKKHIKKDDLILDLGCGANNHLKLLKNEGFEGIGSDISVSALLRNEDLLAVCADSEKLPFKANSFDVVTTTSLLEYIKDKKKILREVKRILKEDGIFITITPNSESLTIKFGWGFLIPLFSILKKEHKQHYYPFKEKEFIKQAKIEGFEIIKLHYLPITYLTLPRRWRPIFKKLGSFFKEEVVIVLRPKSKASLNTIAQKVGKSYKTIDQYKGNSKVSKKVFDIICCPNCKSDLIWSKKENILRCKKCEHDFDIKKRIPILLPKK